jgi:streptogramin lyase
MRHPEDRRSTPPLPVLPVDGSSLTRRGRPAPRSSGHTRLLPLFAMLAGLAAAVMASVAFAEESSVQQVSQPAFLTRRLIEEANDAPTAEMAHLEVDSQAASELPHTELDRAEALKLLTSVFGEAVETPAGLFDEIPPGRFVSTNAEVVPPESAAIVAEEDDVRTPAPEPNGPALIESGLPLLTRNETGVEEPVDLGLKPAEGELQEQNPIVSAGIPAELDAGIELAGGQIGISFPGTAGERVPTTVEGNSAFYPNIQEDTDLLVAPMPTGVETLTQIRSAEAPRTEVEHLSLPAGASLVTSEAGGAEVMFEGRQLMEVQPPTAVDAAGAPVPTNMSVSGGDLMITVAPQPGASFPLIVDPNFRLDQFNWTWGGSTFAGWHGVISAPGYWALQHAGSIPALELSSGYPGGATPNTGAQWLYTVPNYYSDQTEPAYHEMPKSWIEYVSLNGLMYLDDSPHTYYPEIVGGILDPHREEWVSVGTYNGTQGEITGWAGNFAYTGYGNTKGKIFSFGLITLENESQARLREALSAEAIVELRDEDTPTFSGLTEPEGWWNTGEPALSYVAEDDGLGVADLKIEPEGQPSAAQTYALPCSGTNQSPCARAVSSASAGSPTIKLNATTAPEGRDKYILSVFDPLYGYQEGGADPTPHVATRKISLKVDHSPPALSLSGTLTEQASLGTALPHYSLRYNAADGAEGAPTYIGSEFEGTLHNPSDVVRNGQAIWIVDKGSNRIVKTGLSGEVLGSYSAVGIGALSAPASLDSDASGNIWVADSGNNRLVEFNSSGEWMRKVGKAGVGNSEFSSPQGIAVAPGGNVWVADTGNNRVEEFTSLGAFVGAFGSKGSGSGQFSEPVAVAVAPNGNVWIADTGNNRIEELNGQGKFIASYGSLGSGNSQLNHPVGVQADSRGSIWVADQNNGRVEQFSERGEYLGQFGTKGTGSGQFNFSGTAGIASSPSGELWVTDSGNNRLQVWNPPAGTRSGVRKIVVKVDGKEVEHPEVNCPQGGCPLAGEITLNSGEYSAGAHTVEVTAIDGVGLSKTEKVNFTLNPPVPTIALSGTITEQAGPGYTRPGYTLNVAASAQEGTGTSSLVKIEVAVDGKAIESWEAHCVLETCPSTRELRLESSAYEPGTHTLVVKATDGYGQWTSKSRTFKVERDTTKPSLQVGGELANAPEGWVQQESYDISTSATDLSGYGVTSLLFRIDGAVVASAQNACLQGGCEATISKQISMAAYAGGAHEAEVVATDGAGNQATKRWTINVDPEGEISTAEATATLEAAEETSANLLVGESKEESSEGPDPDLGLESTESGYAATGSAVPLTFGSEPGGAVAVQVLDPGELLPICATEAGEISSEEGCQTPSEAGPNDTVSVEVTPIGISAGASSNQLVEENASVAANTQNGVDTVIRPLNNGGMIFEAIRDQLAPEEYSYQVELGEEQGLRQIDPQHVGVYTAGELAVTISATPASDAVGTAVPTTLRISEENIVTLTVQYKAGNSGVPFVYPVMAGSGWEGGFRTVLDEMRNPLGESEAGGPEGPPARGYHDFSFAVGAPEPEPEATASDDSGDAGRPHLRIPFFGSDCRWHEARFIPFVTNCTNYAEQQELKHPYWERNLLWRGVEGGHFWIVQGHTVWYHGNQYAQMHCEVTERAGDWKPESWGCAFNGAKKQTGGPGAHIVARSTWQASSHYSPSGEERECRDDYEFLYANGDFVVSPGSPHIWATPNGPDEYCEFTPWSFPEN